MKPDICSQIGFYLLSMMFFFVIVAILGTDIPFCFEDDAVFIGVWKCLGTPGIVIPIVCLFALIMIGLFVLYLKCRMTGTNLGPIEIEDAENINGDVMTFVGSYFLPLVGFNFIERWQGFAVLAILFVLTGIIYIRSEIYYTNPTLLVWGYRVYRITGIYLGNEVHKIVIVRDRLNKGDRIMYIPIDDNTYYAIIEKQS